MTTTPPLFSSAHASGWSSIRKMDLELIYGKKWQCSKEAALDSSTVSTTYPLDLRLMKEDTHNIWLAPVVGYVFEVIRWEYNLIYSVMVQ
uniref:Uncharacterized protein n=1 Tax=Oryza glumipatula TaxID=40148 RepID=A0A0E0BS19_9ORYZ